MKALALLFFLAAPAFAGSIKCDYNYYYPRMNIQWDEKQVTVEVFSPRGYKDLPQWEPPLALDAIPFMQMQAKELEGLGDTFTFAWDKKQCEWDKDDEFLISCTGLAKRVDTKNPDPGVKARLFTTARIEERSLSGKQSVIRLRFIFEKQNMYFTAIPFPTPFCKVEK